MTSIGAMSVLGSKVYDLYDTIFGKPIEIPKKNVVVIGYGWAGKSFCDNINTKKYDVTVISKTNYMLNTPQLKNSVLDKESETLKILPTSNNVKFINGECTEIIKPTQCVISDKGLYQYDYLVLAVGGEVNDFGISGIKENCYFLKNEDDIKKLSEKLKNNKDQKVIIMGGGPVGIELAFELSKVHKNIKILEGLNTILPNFSNDARDMITKELDNNNIKLLLNNKVSKVDNSKIYSNYFNTQQEYIYDIAIWNCGIKPNKLISFITDDKKLITYDNFRVHNISGGLSLKQSQIYAIGDISDKMPPTAQNAKQQGKYLANYFNNNFTGENYEYKEKGKLIHTKDNIILDSAFGTYKLPKFLESYIDYMLI